MTSRSSFRLCLSCIAEAGAEGTNNCRRPAAATLPGADNWRIDGPVRGCQFDIESWQAFAERIHYCQVDIQRAEDFQRLAGRLSELEQARAADRISMWPCATAYHTVAAVWGGRHGGRPGRGAANRYREAVWYRSGIARQLNQDINGLARTRSIASITIGKETVQNIMVLRFGNSIFEPLWNRNYIDHVQITVAEEVVIGRRAGYYDQSGVLRDMFQNHLFQLLMVIGMEAPVKYNADCVRDEKVKVLRAVRPLHGSDFATCGVRGQYRGYVDEEGVAPGSPTETFAALKLHVDNWRWNGVPFYLRSGKGMSCRTTQIVIEFKEPPHLVFSGGRESSPQANRLVIQIQPAEGIQVHFQSKVPDQGMRLRTSQLDFRFDDAYRENRCPMLISGCCRMPSGDASLFARKDEVRWPGRLSIPSWPLASAAPDCRPTIAVAGARGVREWLSPRARLV